MMLTRYRIGVFILFAVISSIAYANTENNPPLTEQADTAFANGDYKRAKIYYHKVLRTDATNAVAMLNIAKCEEILGNIQQAIDYATKSKQADARYTDAYLVLGRLYSLQSDWIHARIAYQTAAVLEPNNMQAHFGLGNVVSAQGEMRTASKHYARYNKLKQQNENANPQRVQQIDTNNTKSK